MLQAGLATRISPAQIVFALFWERNADLRGDFKLITREKCVSFFLQLLFAFRLRRKLLFENREDFVG